MKIFVVIALCLVEYLAAGPRITEGSILASTAVNEDTVLVDDEPYDYGDVTDDDDGGDGDREEADDDDDDEDDGGCEQGSEITVKMDNMDIKDAELIDNLDERLSNISRAEHLVISSGLPSLFEGAKRLQVTRCGPRFTAHYAKPGSYVTALKDFLKLGPYNIKPLTGARYKGFSGNIGTGPIQYKINVRSGNSKHNPSLSLVKNNFVRVFRYN